MQIKEKIIKSLAFIMIYFSLTAAIEAQNYSSAIGVFGGVSQDGYAGMLNYNYYTDRNDFIQVGIYISSNESEFRDTIKIPYNDFTINAGYFTSIIQNRFKTLTLNAGGGIVGGYEAINNGDKELANGAIIIDKSRFIYGAFASIEVEKSLGDGDWSLILKLNEFYHHNSDLGKFTPFVGLGLRYFIF